MKKELTPKPDFKAIEERWQNFWAKEKIYRFDPKSKKPIYSIDSPPPTMSGRFPSGHAFSYTHFDIIARFKRMTGFNVFLPIGFDDNGQPSERYVEKKHNIKSKDLLRSEFNKLVDKELKEMEEEYKKDSQKMGFSYDWDLFYRTISDYCARTSQLSFLDLHKKKLVYRAEEPVLWCPHCTTSQSQADVEDTKRKTKLNYINFELESGKKIEIATTRPEFLPACVGIFVAPDDERYKKLIGQKAIVPLFGFKVLIMPDEKVDKEFGSGIVMVCTFGDSTDIDWWKKHKLPLKIIITPDGKLNSNAGKYAGLDFRTAREAILNDLANKGYLIKQEEIEQTIGTCWRCSTPLEFYVAKQWFIKLLDNKFKFIELGRKIKWHPAFYQKRYEDWVSNLSWDWVLSRQRYFGIPIPVWYCKKCSKVILPDEKDLPVNPLETKPKRSCDCGGNEFEPEADTFDTWMTSSLTPELTTGWADKSQLHEKICPFDLRPSGSDIVRTWEFYTIVKSFYHFKKLPWKNTLITGMLQDAKGQAMHKSKGNAIDPLEVIAKYSADTFRYFTVISTVGEDLKYQEKEVLRGTNIAIKLWNAARFAGLHIKGVSKKPKLEIIDRWIIGRLNETLKAYMDKMNSYEICAARKDAEMFFLHEFCDFYLEMVKYRIYGADLKSKQSAQATLYECLLAILKLWAPILPHITEEVYQTLFRASEKDESIHISLLPKPGKLDKEALKLGGLACQLISELRKWKKEKFGGLGNEVDSLTIYHPWAKDLEKIKADIAGTMRIKQLYLRTGKLKIV